MSDLSSLGIQLGLKPMLAGQTMTMGSQAAATMTDPSMPTNTQETPVQQDVYAPSLWGIGKAVVVGTLAGALTSTLIFGEPFLDVATAMNGALGAGVGLGAGAYWVQTQQKSLIPYLPLVTAVAVPAIVGGVLDTHVVAIGLGTFAGASFAGGV